MSKTKNGLLKGLTPKVVVIGLAISIGLGLMGDIGVWSYYTPGFQKMTPSYGNFYYIRCMAQLALSMGVVFWVLFLGAVVNKVAKRPVFNGAELAILAIISPIGSLFNTITFDGSFWTFYFWKTVGGLCRAPFSSYLPEDLHPLAKYLPEYLLYGDEPFVDFTRKAGLQYITAPIISWYSWFTITMVATLLASMSISLLLRRLWVEIEELPFPTLPEVSTNMVDLSMPKDDGSSSLLSRTKSKYFWIGFAIQFAWYALLIWPDYRYMNPQTSSYESAPGYDGNLHSGIDLWPGRVLSSAIQSFLPWVSLFITFWPWQLGWGYMMPLDVLNGFFIGWLFFLVVMPPVYTSLNLLAKPAPGDVNLVESTLTRISQATGFGTLPNYINSLQFGINAGLIIGLAIWPLWTHRRLMKKIALSLIHEPEQSEDPDRPMKYRYVWILLIVSLIVVWSAMVYMMVPIEWGIPTLLLELLIMTGFSRFLAETGGLFWFMGQQTLGMTYTMPGSMFGATLGLYKGDGYNTTEFAMTHFHAAGGMTQEDSVAGYNYMGLQAAGQMITLNGFKTGYTFKIKLKDVLIAILIGVIVSFIGITIGHMLYYATHELRDFPPPEIRKWPDQELGAWWPGWAWGNTLEWGVPGAIASDGGVHEWYGFLVDSVHLTPYLTWLAVGFIIAGLLPMVRRRIPAFRISVAGILLGMNFGAQIWFPMLIGYIAKVLTLKTGGTKLYADIGKPLALGALVGVCAAALPTMIFQTLAFYYLTHGGFGP